MGGGGSAPQVQAPAPVAPPTISPAQEALQQRQADLLQQQSDILAQQWKQQQLLAPVMYKQAGLTPTMDAAGNITGFTQIPDPVDPNKALTDSINTQLLQREQAALQGTLPIDPNLTNELNKQDTTLNQQLQSNLGPGYATSTPGIQALAEQAKRRGELTFNVSTGALSNAAALQQAQAGQTADLTNQSLNRILAASSPGTNFASLYGNAATGVGSALQPYMQNNQLSLQAALGNQQAGLQTSIANQQAATAARSQNMGLFGSVIGAGAGLGAAYMMGPSSIAGATVI